MRSWRALAFLMAGALLLPACAGTHHEEPAEEAAHEIATYTIEEFLGTTDFRGASFSPSKDKILVSSDMDGIYNAFAVPLSGGDPVPLTTSTTESIFTYSYFPEDERFLFHSDRGGDELDHVFVRTPEGEEVDLTPGENVKADFLGWTRDDTTFLISTNERDSRFFDIYEYRTDSYQREMIFQNDSGYEFQDLSPDKRYFVFSKPRTTSESEVILYDRQGGETTNITSAGPVLNGFAATFHPVDGSLYYVTTEEGDFASLKRYDLASGGKEIVIQPDWDVQYASFSKEGKYLVVGINNDSRTEIRAYEAATMTPLELPEMPSAEITAVSVSRDETTMAFYVSSSRHPRDLFVYRIGAGEPRQLTRSLSQAIDPADLVEARVVRFASYDGLEIPGVLYKPHQAGAESKAPAVVWVHGGPGGQSRVGYSGLIQYLVNHGYVLYAINNRGSSGYGKNFNTLDDRKHGEADLGDCVASKAMLIETGYVDPDRIAIVGGSYGGFMVLAALTSQPEEFAAGVDIFGVSNWVRTLESIPPYWESFRKALYEELGDPAEDKERLTRISPLFHADRIVRPMLVLQGANDPRVLKIESDEIVERARGNGAEVEYVVFEDEGHGFVKKENRLKGYRAIREFLDKHLRDAPPVTAGGGA